MFEASRSPGATCVAVGGERVGGPTAADLEARRPGTPADHALAVLERAGRDLAGAVVDCREWSGHQRAAALRALDVLTGVLATTRAHLIVAEQNAGTAVRPGDRDFASARARVTRSGYGQAVREIAQATTLATLPTVAGAVQAGDVPLAHVDALARVRAGASAEGAAALASPEGQAAIVGLAERLPVRDFAARLAQLVAAQDPAGLEHDAARQRSARFLHLSHQPDGTYLRGRLDRISGEILRGALAATGQAPDETRDKAQADADALVALARRAASGMAGVRARRTDPSGTHVLADPGQDAADVRVSGVAARPHLTLLVPAETFAEVLEHGRARARDGEQRSEQTDWQTGEQTDWQTGEQTGWQTGEQTDWQTGEQTGWQTGEQTGWRAPARTGSRAPAPAPGEARAERPARRRPPANPATLEDGTPVAMSQLATALCDCEISRVVLAAGSVPVDLGRTQRLYPAAHRRAVIVRDRHCAWNGCEVPAAFCEVHHIRWWGRDHGPTSLENAVLLCDHHHHTVHVLDLTARRHAAEGDGSAGPPVRYTFRHRDGRVASAPPRGRPVDEGAEDPSGVLALSSA